MTITPPAFQKDAVPSLKGWHHPKTNELLKSQRISQGEIDEFNGVVMEIPREDVELIVDSMCATCDENGNCTCDDVAVVDSTNDIPDDIEGMSKRELEAYAREHLDVELDRRKSRKALMQQVAELVKS